jgi:hypothetical protein
MAIRAGFAEIDITPPVGTHKIGWLKVIVSDRVIDPLFAKAAVFESGGRQVAFIQLDTCFIEAADAAEIRRRIAARYAFPGGAVMVSATHNHAGPAVADCGDVRRDAAYTDSMIEKVAAMFGRALEGLRPAEIGLASTFEFGLTYNRRVVMRDGSVKCQHTFDDPESLYVEGPIDPEVAVLAARDAAGLRLGAVVNFACHPTHHGGETGLSAGYPGALAAQMRTRGFPVTLFLNGACGNIIFFDPARSGRGRSMEEMGRVLAEDACRAIGAMEFSDAVDLRAASRTVAVPWRRVGEEDLRGTARGAERFIDPAIYERTMPAVLDQMRRSAACNLEVQVLSLGDRDYVGIPGEYFVQNGFLIKEGAHPRHALVVECANGCAWYIPHKGAFPRGGYETTFPGSRLVPEAGEILADAAIGLVRGARGR